MAASLILPWVQGLVGKAADVLVQRVTGMRGVENYRRKLEEQLVYVQSLLADAEEKAEAKTKAGRAVKAWMKKLKAAAYQADDILDDFRYEALRREAQAGESMSRRKVLYFSCDRTLFHHKASRDLKNVLDKIDELVAEMNTFGLLQRAEAPQVLYRQTYSAMDESMEIFGRDDDKEVVVKLLLDQQDKHHVQVLPIIGMGGLGKTTLAKMVFNDRRVHKHFDLKIWHCVSDNFEATAIMRSLIQLATNGGYDLPDNIELLRAKWHDVVNQKRLLLVLDDVWNEEHSKWEDDLKPLLCSSNGGSGSMIVVTCRSPQVASIMCTFPPYELACLSEDDSWKLFSKKAFSKGVQTQTELVTIGKCIVNKCKGLPLAVKTLGGLVSSMHQVQEWKTVAASNIGDTVRGKDEILSILKLSYRHLSPEMKQCFAFCAIFPKDYKMEKDKLIQLWLANGFIHEDQTMESLARKAEFVFNELAWRSFLEDVKLRTFVHHSFHVYEAIGCKMHDLMHDLAKHVAQECAFASELILKKRSIEDVQYMQVSGMELGKISGLFQGSSPLRTLLVESKQDDHKISKLMSLRALCCRDPSIIDIQFTNTAHLRYLDLSGSDIISLPNSICMLYNLLSLRLNNCQRLEYLPEGVTALRNLEHLYLLECKSLKRMPTKLSLLHNIRTLTTFVVDTEDGCGIEEVKDMQQLSNMLELYNLQKVKCGSKANLHLKQNLNELMLCWGRIYRERFTRRIIYSELDNPTIDEVNNQEQVMESLVPHGELKILEVHGYSGLTITPWMRNPQMFRYLRELIMTNCRGCKYLPIVWLSSSLERLSIHYMESLTMLFKSIYVEAEAYSMIFPKLKTMELICLPELERWAENSAGVVINSLVFPLLEKLTIKDCYKLASLPETPVLTCLNLSHQRENDSTDGQQSRSQRSLDTLRYLEIQGDDSFVSILNKSKLQLGLRDYLVFVEELHISSCSNIVCWPLDELCCLLHLRSLHIWECSKLEGKSSSSSEEEEILPLPQLEKLVISSCDSLLQIPKLPASLEEIKIEDRTSLVALPSNLGNLAKLRKLYVWSCGALKELPNGTGGLTSLEKLSIDACPGIEKFPKGLLQRIPTLKHIDIDGCPDLQTRCREGGEYFHLVSCIPSKYIPSAKEPRKGKGKVEKVLRHWFGVANLN